MKNKKYDIKEVQTLSNTKTRIKVIHNTAVKRRINKRKR